MSRTAQDKRGAASGPDQERKRAAMPAVLRETYPEATEKELERLLLLAMREAEARRRELERERMARLRLLLFGPEPERPERFHQPEIGSGSPAIRDTGDTPKRRRFRENC